MKSYCDEKEAMYGDGRGSESGIAIVVFGFVELEAFG